MGVGVDANRGRSHTRSLQTICIAVYNRDDEKPGHECSAGH